MSKKSDYTYDYILLVSIIIIFSLGVLVYNHYKPITNNVNIVEEIKFDESRTILKMKKDSVISILEKWHELDPSKFESPIYRRRADWISWPYNDRFSGGIMEEILGDEVAYGGREDIIWNDLKSYQIKLKVNKDTCYIYVRMITQYFSKLNTANATN